MLFKYFLIGLGSVGVVGGVGIGIYYGVKSNEEIKDLEDKSNSVASSGDKEKHDSGTDGNSGGSDSGK